MDKANGSLGLTARVLCLASMVLRMECWASWYSIITKTSTMHKGQRKMHDTSTCVVWCFVKETARAA